MKSQVSPVAAIAAIVVVLGIAVFALIRMGGSPAGANAGEKPPGMPADAAAEFTKRMGSANTTGAKSTGAPPGGMGVNMAPPGR